MDYPNSLGWYWFSGYLGLPSNKINQPIKVVDLTKEWVEVNGSNVPLDRLHGSWMLLTEYK